MSFWLDESQLTQLLHCPAYMIALSCVPTAQTWSCICTGAQYFPTIYVCPPFVKMVPCLRGTEGVVCMVFTAVWRGVATHPLPDAQASMACGEATPYATLTFHRIAQTYTDAYLFAAKSISYAARFRETSTYSHQLGNHMGIYQQKGAQL